MEEGESAPYPKGLTDHPGNEEPMKGTLREVKPPGAGAVGQAGGPRANRPADAAPSSVQPVGPQAGGNLTGGEKPSEPVSIAATEAELPRLRIEMDEAGQPRLRFLEGDQTVKVVALNQQAFNALIEEGLLCKPRSLEVGVMRNWVKLDGQLFRFDGDGNGAAGLEEALNDRYVLPDESSGHNVVVFSNPASPTGFDLQFPASPLGFAENRRRHLNEETIEILQDP